MDECQLKTEAKTRVTATTGDQVGGFILIYFFKYSLIQLQIWRPINEREVRDQLQHVYDMGIRSLAVVFLHSYM